MMRILEVLGKMIEKYGNNTLFIFVDVSGKSIMTGEAINTIVQQMENCREACCDGCDGALYEPRMLYTPRICMTEDSYDIVITTIIPYDFWEVAPLETADYLTAYCPELLDGLTFDIFGMLIGKITVGEAIRSIERNILGIENEQTHV